MAKKLRSKWSWVPQEKHFLSRNQRLNHLHLWWLLQSVLRLPLPLPRYFKLSKLTIHSPHQRKAAKKPEIEVLTSKLEELSTSKYEDSLSTSIQEENTKYEETFTSSPIFESKTAPISIVSKQMSYSQTSYSQPSSYSSEFIIPPSSSLPNSSSSSILARDSALSEEEDKPELETLHSPPDEIEMTWKWGSLPTAAPL